MVPTSTPFYILRSFLYIQQYISYPEVGILLMYTCTYLSRSYPQADADKREPQTLSSAFSVDIDRYIPTYMVFWYHERTIILATIPYHLHTFLCKEQRHLRPPSSKQQQVKRRNKTASSSVIISSLHSTTTGCGKSDG